MVRDPLWDAIKEWSKEVRKRNTENGTRMVAEYVLKKKNIPFVSHNNGVHLFIADRYDYWPSTGLVIDRKTKKRFRGVNSLIKRLGGNT